MTYEYVCTACHHEWEAEQRISAKPLETCPSCGHKSAKRQVSGGAGFILKGGGWYADGYTAKAPADAKKSTGQPATASKDSGVTAKEAAPAKAVSEPAAAPASP